MNLILVKINAKQKSTGKRVKLNFVSGAGADELARQHIERDYDFSGLADMHFSFEFYDRDSQWVSGDLVPFARTNKTMISGAK
jgi:hypothetical protein